MSSLQIKGLPPLKGSSQSKGLPPLKKLAKLNSNPTRLGVATQISSLSIKKGLQSNTNSNSGPAAVPPPHQKSSIVGLDKNGEPPNIGSNVELKPKIEGRSRMEKGNKLTTISRQERTLPPLHEDQVPASSSQGVESRVTAPVPLKTRHGFLGGFNDEKGAQKLPVPVAAVKEEVRQKGGGGGGGGGRGGTRRMDRERAEHRIEMRRGKGIPTVPSSLSSPSPDASSSHHHQRKQKSIIITNPTTAAISNHSTHGSDMKRGDHRDIRSSRTSKFIHKEEPQPEQPDDYHEDADVSSMDGIFIGKYQRYRRFFESAGYDSLEAIRNTPVRRRADVVNIVASDMAADGLRVPENERLGLKVILSRIPPPLLPATKSSRKKNRQQQQQQQRERSEGSSLIPPSAGDERGKHGDGAIVNRRHYHPDDLEQGGFSDDKTANHGDDGENTGLIEAMTLGSKDAAFQWQSCFDACGHITRQRWAYTFVIMTLLLTVSLLLWAANRDLRDANDEARDPSLAGAWNFIEILAYLGFALTGIAFLICTYTASQDITLLAILHCIFTCDCDTEIDCDFACLDSCDGCTEPGGCCYRDPLADPVCQCCDQDPDARPCCYRDPDAPAFCGQEDSPCCPRDPDAPPCCVDEEGRHCFSKLGDVFDCSRYDFTIPDCTCTCDCLPEGCCTDFQQFCNTCIKICTCQCSIQV